MLKYALSTLAFINILSAMAGVVAIIMEFDIFSNNSDFMVKISPFLLTLVSVITVIICGLFIDYI
jgi:hypothetical protein|nr:MAG TPA: hypothetical protein [Caudoviricetes sp.]